MFWFRRNRFCGSKSPLSRLRVAQVQKPARQPDERLLHEIFRQLAVAREQVREPDRIRAVADIQISEASSLRPGLVRHLGSRHPPSI